MEEKEIQLITNETFLKIMEHQRQTIEGYKKIAFTSLATVILTVLITCVSIFYFFSTYEVEVLDTTTTTTTYEQSSDGESQIINGNSYNDNSVHNEKGE